MTEIDVLDCKRGATGGYKVDVTGGERVGRVSSEWFSRPADERFLSLSELFASVNGPRRAQPDPNGRERRGAGRGQSG